MHIYMSIFFNRNYFKHSRISVVSFKVMYTVPRTGVHVSAEPQIAFQHND